MGDFDEGGDRFIPGTLLPYKWETPDTIQRHSWGYDRTEGILNDGFLSVYNLLWLLVSTVSCNG